MQKRRIGFIIAVVCIAAVLAGMALPGIPRAAATSAQSGNTVKVQKVTTKVGKTFTIQLVSNASTGYSWKVMSNSKPKVVKFVKSVYAAAATTKVIGAPGHETLSFKALAKGTAVITLGYVRPWEKGVKPVQTVKLTVVVK